jgi:hypothetical protein
MHRYPLSLLLCGLVFGCGDDEAKPSVTDTTDTTDTSDVGDTRPDVELPTGCYLPSTPTATMDCDLMCEKVVACGVTEADCLEDCLAYTYLLAPEAGPKVEECFVDLPCNQHPAAFGAIGCVALLAEDTSYTPPAGNAAACSALEAKAQSCGVAEEVKTQVAFLCEHAGHALSVDLMGRANVCAAESCEGFVACLSGSSCFWDGLRPDEEIPVEVDACLNSRDANAIGTSDVIGSALTCVDGCLDGTFTCAQSCLVDTAGLTGSCSTCYAVLGRCVRTECDGRCADPMSEGCQTCLADRGCAGAFRTCAGRPIPGGPDDQVDCTAGEQTEIRGEPMIENIAKCVRQCQDGATCNDECMGALLFVEGRCTGCAGDLATCAGQTCGDACDDPDDEIGCYACLSQGTCLEGFALCSAVVVPHPPGAACLGAADRAAVESGAAWAQAGACLASCEGAACGGCVSADVDVSASCQGCFSTFVGCTSGCKSACSSATSPECAGCIADTSCLAGFEGCAGLAPFTPPALGDDTCDAAVDCALACSGVNSATCVEACVQGAQPSLIALSREVAACVRTTCQGRDVSCLATECLGAYQQCYAVTPSLSCVGLDTCLSACATAGCQLECFVQSQDALAVNALLDRNACVGRFCGSEPTPGCATLVVNDLAFCAIDALECEDPEFSPPTLECREAATCVSYCPDEACTDTCPIATLPAPARAALGGFIDCVVDECSGDLDRRCIVEQCWSAFNGCYGEPGFGLTCAQVLECQNQCAGISCADGCLGTAADASTAGAFLTYVACIQTECTGPDGQLLVGCPEQAVAQGSACHGAYLGCFVP